MEPADLKVTIRFAYSPDKVKNGCAEYDAACIDIRRYL
jgi:hypothetical protein